ncbi:Aste57867_10412 [Aphanomyces stellatus]|uniref:Aste57867_10412 protein n=1 Tax=Aphanomyces stellatus TaxID=120398 RepID=A0A485KRC5_9STRA|nr:hypothetical protein As57867_010372 [Aphanomyces stellatus]VFT87286.1 Aste57867_10412 [Aphanomyces stellatus]
MASVVPIAGSLPEPVISFALPKFAKATAGILYVVGSCAASVYYLALLLPSVANDLWWPNFNSTGLQTFVADVFNARLQLDQTGPFPLLDDAGTIVQKDYATATTFIDIPPTSARLVLLANLSFDVVVVAMRQTSLDVNLQMFASYCWADYSRRFEVAHTSGQQRRCDQHEQTNAAAYFESLVRNIDVTDLFGSAAVDTQYESALFNPIASMSTDGAMWVQSMKSHEWLAVVDEVAYWQAQNLWLWATDMQNYILEGLDDTIMIRNALGMTQAFTINRIAPIVRGLSLWTTFIDSVGFLNDVQVAVSVNMSVVRQAPDYFGLTGDDAWDNNFVGPDWFTGTTLLRDVLGPFDAINIRWVTLPPTLFTSTLNFDTALRQQILSNATFRRSYETINRVTVLDPVPPDWIQDGMLYYGGSPLCPYGNPQPYVQTMFSYYGTCNTQDLFTVPASRNAALFAAAAMSLGDDGVSMGFVCEHCQTSSMSCAETLTPAVTLSTCVQFDTSIHSTIQAINISFMQLASSSDGANVFFIQPLVTDDAWSYFGWIAIYDWLHGHREVCVFAGDNGNVTLMSDFYDPVALPANPLELPQTASRYIWYISCYVTMVLGVVAMLVLVQAMVAQSFPRYVSIYFVFNRIAGAVWVGRPFQFLRGMTALVLLSTSSSTFVQANGLAGLTLTPRGWLQNMVLASEATWIVYAINDTLLPLTMESAAVAGPLGSCVTWLLLLTIQSTAPYVAVATIERHCDIVILGQQAQCTSGRIDIGSPTRLVELVALVAGTIVVSYAVATLYCRQHPPHHLFLAHEPPHLLIPAATQAFLCDGQPTLQFLDTEACLLSGIVPTGYGLFDLKLWTTAHAFQRTPHGWWFEPARGDLRKVNVQPRKTDAAEPIKTRSRGLALLGLVYVTASMASSLCYLMVTGAAMSNDFWWSSFAAPRTQTFLINWFNRYLQFNHSIETTLDQSMYGDATNPYNSSNSLVFVPPAYASHIQNDINTLVRVVHALREMDGCELPWISTAYCFVDFNQTWEMANSATRQMRCANDTANAAIYLEAVLRNANWPQLMGCWQPALQVGVLEYLNTLHAGQTWLHLVQAVTTTVDGEVDYWHSQGISSYTTQWQNGKSLGVVETFTIQNAFGRDYPLTLKASNWTRHDQTSYKMSWPLACDLWTVGFNTTTQSGQSLVRGSSTFVFLNVSIQDILVANGTLSSPLGRGMALVQETLGPFGSVELKRVAIPRSLTRLVESFTQHVGDMLRTEDAQTALANLPNPPFLLVAPPAWLTMDSVGGDLLCEVQTQPMTGLLVFFGPSGTCTTNAGEAVQPTIQLLLQGLLALPTTNQSVEDVVATACSCVVFQPNDCVHVLTHSMALVRSFSTSDELVRLATAAQAVRDEIRAQVQIELVQFVNDMRSVVAEPEDTIRHVVQRFASVMDHRTFERVLLFDPVDPSFDFIAWLFLVEWVEGKRDVVSFHGDIGTTLTTLTTASDLQKHVANALEIPTNVAVYVWRVNQYVTATLLGIAVVVVGYIGASLGHVDGLNMLKFNRVAGLVWIGRPLLLVRGVSALCLLSTAKLDLHQRGLYYSMVATDAPLYMTILSSGELGWLVYVLQDLSSVVGSSHNRQPRSFKWTGASGIVAWVAAAAWSWLAPVRHNVTLARDCSLDSVDGQAVCRSGFVRIGDSTRFVGLVLVAVASCLVCSALDYFVHAVAPVQSIDCPRIPPPSFALSSVAANSFVTQVHENVVYLDRASAILNGLVTVRLSTRLIVFDVKTNRLYTINDNDRPAPFEFGVPLVG